MNLVNPIFRFILPENPRKILPPHAMLHLVQWIGDLWLKAAEKLRDKNQVNPYWNESIFTRCLVRMMQKNST